MIALEAQLALPDIPDALGYLWHIYLRLRYRAAVGFSGAQPIGWQDLCAFVELTRVHLAHWEIAIIERIDDAFLHPGDDKPEPQGRPMTEHLFDTIFK